MATRARVPIYALSARSLPGASTPDPGVNSLDWERYRASTRRSLRTLSAQTGGFTFTGDEDLVEMLRRIGHAMRQ